MEPILSIARPNDMDTLLEFVCEYYAFDRHPYDRDAVRAALEGLLRDPGLGRVGLVQHHGQAAFTAQCGGRSRWPDPWLMGRTLGPQSAFGRKGWQ